MGVPEAGGARGNPLGLRRGLPRPPRSWVWAVSFLQLQGTDMCVLVCVRVCVHVSARAREQECWRTCVHVYVCTQSRGMQVGRPCPGGWPLFSASQGAGLQWRVGVWVCGALASCLPSLAGLHEGAACSLAALFPSPSLSRLLPLCVVLCGQRDLPVAPSARRAGQGCACLARLPSLRRRHPLGPNHCAHVLTLRLTHTHKHMGVKACRGARPRGSRQVVEGSSGFGEHGVYWRAGGQVEAAQ